MHTNKAMETTTATKTLGWCSEGYHESLKRTCRRGLGSGCDADVWFNCLKCKSTLLILGEDAFDEPTAVEPVQTMEEMIEDDRSKKTVDIKPIRRNS